MATWRRVDPAGLYGVVTFGFVFTGVTITVGMTVVFVMGGQWLVNPVLGMLSAYGFMAIWTGLGWRMFRTGIYASDQSVRIVYPWGSRVIALERGRRGRHPASGAGPMDDGTRHDRPATQRWRGGGGAPVHRTTMFPTGSRRNIGRILSDDDFETTLSVLRGMRANAVAPRHSLI